MSVRQTAKPSHTFTIVLRNGERHSFRSATKPRHWKSWLMHQLPHGTDFEGAKFYGGDQR